MSKPIKVKTGSMHAELLTALQQALGHISYMMTTDSTIAPSAARWSEWNRTKRRGENFLAAMQVAAVNPESEVRSEQDD